MEGGKWAKSTNSILFRNVTVKTDFPSMSLGSSPRQTIGLLDYSSVFVQHDSEGPGVGV